MRDTRHPRPARAEALAWLLALPLLVSACATGTNTASSATAGHAATSAPRPSDIGPYLDMLDRLAPGDTARQSAELAQAQAASLQSPTAGNRLRYAIALGAAGHAESNPVEARRQIAELLAGQHDLKPQEVALGRACMREFDARVALYAELARQREDYEHRLQATAADDDKRVATLVGDNARLKKALAEAERKLEAVAEMERTLTEKGAGPTTERNPRP